MMKITAYLGITLAVVFAALLAYDYAGDYFATRNGGDNTGGNDNVADDTSSSVYPTLSIVKHDATWWTTRFMKDGFLFAFNSDNRAGSTTLDWLKKVQTQANDKMANTKRDENLVFNEYVRSAAKQKGVAMLEENEPGTKYPDGRDFILFVDNNDGEMQVLKVSKEDTEFDLGSLKNPEDVLSTPEATVSVDQAASFFQNLEKKLDERLNASAPVQPVSETTTVAKETKTEIAAKPIQATDISFEGNAGSAQQNSGTNSGMVQAAEINI